MSEIEVTGIKSGIRDYWDTQGIIYDFGYESDEECEYWQNLFKEVIGESKKNILDVGSGTGFIAMNLAALGHSVTGLDFSDGMLRQAEDKMKKRNFKWDTVIGDAEHPDFMDETFDVIICRYLLWTLPNPETAIHEWVRILKPGGTVVIIDGNWNRNSESYAMKINKRIWFICRRIMCGYTGIFGHDTRLEKDLPLFGGASADKISEFLRKENINSISIRTLDELPDIVKRNLPWYLKIGYRYGGRLHMVCGDKKRV